MKKSFILLMGSLIMLFTMASAQDADEILDTYFENTGGMEKWVEMKTMVWEGKFPTPQGDFPFTVYAKEPNMTKIVINIQGKEMIPQAFDGEIAWGVNPMMGSTTPQQLPEEQTKMIRDDAQFEDDFINYSEKGHEVELMGKEEIDGAECFKIKLIKNKNNDKDEKVEFHYFDTENYVPIMVEQTVQAGPSAGTTTQTYLSDYQETDYGIYMPYYIESRVDGNVIQKLVLEEISINAPVEDEIFAFPEN